MNDDLITTVNRGRLLRGWTDSELAQRAGMSRKSMHAVLTGKREVTARFCIRLASAFQTSPEEFLQLAGVTDPDPGFSTLGLQEITDTYNNLSIAQQDNVLRFARLAQRKDYGVLEDTQDVAAALMELGTANREMMSTVSKAVQMIHTALDTVTDSLDIATVTDSLDITISDARSQASDDAKNI